MDVACTLLKKSSRCWNTGLSWNSRLRTSQCNVLSRSRSQSINVRVRSHVLQSGSECHAHLHQPRDRCRFALFTKTKSGLQFRSLAKRKNGCKFRFFSFWCQKRENEKAGCNSVLDASFDLGTKTRKQKRVAISFSRFRSQNEKAGASFVFRFWVQNEKTKKRKSWFNFRFLVPCRITES